MLWTVKVLVAISCLYVQAYSYRTDPKNTSLDTNDTMTLDVRPKNYNILITPYFIEEHSEKYLSFESVVEIELEVKRCVKNITLHSKNLTFERKNCTLRTVDGIDVDDFTVDFETNKDLVHFSKTYGEFPEGIFFLKISYVGSISNEEELGMFSKFYINDKKENVPYLVYVTSDYARSILPCFDDPNYKATFDVTINHNLNYVALSNTPIKKISYANSRAVSLFKKTPLMSVDQLAFVVFDFKNISNDANNFTVWTTQELLPKADLILNLDQKVLTELENFTNIPYEIGKLDTIGLPISWNKVVSKWGLIIHGLDTFLEQSYSANVHPTKLAVAFTLTDQWFGVIPTPKSMKYNWLTGSLNIYMAHYILDRVDPLFTAMNYIVKNYLPVFDYHNPGISNFYWIENAIVQNDFFHIDQIPSLYDKGMFVVHMMRHILTEPVFDKGLQNYLKKSYHRNVNSDDLYQAIQEVLNDKNIKLQLKPFMDSWMNFKGYPIVSVKRNYLAGEIQFEQTRFFVNEASKEEKSDNHNWHIPINYASKEKSDFDNTSPEYWLTNSSMTIHTNVGPEDWIIVNKQLTGLYVVNYDNENWELIINELMSPNRETIHLFNRAQLLNDAFLLTQQDKLDWKILLRLHNYLKNETNCLAWYPGSIVLQFLNNQLKNTKSYPKFQEYASRATYKMIESIGFGKNERDNEFTKSCKRKVLSVACQTGSQLCKNITLEKFTLWLQDPKKYSLAPNLKKSILSYGLQNFEKFDEWHTYFSNNSRTYNADVQKELFHIAGYSKNKEFLRKHLDALKSHSLIDIYIFFTKMLFENSVSMDTILDLLIDNLPLFSKKKSLFYLALIIEESTARMTSQSQLDRLLQSKFIGKFSKAVSRGLEKSEKKVQWLEKNEETIIELIDELQKLN